MFKHLGQAAVWTYTVAPLSGDPLVRALTHLGQARVLQAEAFMGYPEHCGLLIGHLACASEELWTFDTEVAARIRQERLKWSPVLYGGDRYEIDIEDILRDLVEHGFVENAVSSDGDAFTIFRRAMIYGHLSEAAEEGWEASHEIAPRILTFLSEWQEGMATGQEPALVYEDLFDSLIHVMKEKGTEEFEPVGLEGLEPEEGE